MPFFSVIIPVYNVETYLQECIESVLGQSFRDFEVILVDDGSTDNSPEICEMFAKKDSRIKVIYKENGGASSARNKGLNVAIGRYVVFLDSDDYWSENDALKELQINLEKSNYQIDALIYHNYLKFPNGEILIDREGRSFPQNFNILSKEESIAIMVEKDILPGGACTMAMKHQFLFENNLYFKEGIKSEDTEWMFRFINSMPRIHNINKRFYVYRKGREGSVTNMIGYEHLKQYIDIVRGCTEMDFVNEKVRTCLLSYGAYHLSIIMSLIAQLKEKEQRKELIQEITGLKGLLKYNLNPKVRKVNTLVKVCGFQNSCKVLGIYLKIRNH